MSYGNDEIEFYTYDERNDEDFFIESEYDEPFGLMDCE